MCFSGFVRFHMVQNPWKMHMGVSVFWWGYWFCGKDCFFVVEMQRCFIVWFVCAFCFCVGFIWIMFWSKGEIYGIFVGLVYDCI